MEISSLIHHVNKRYKAKNRDEFQKSVINLEKEKFDSIRWEKHVNWSKDGHEVQSGLPIFLFFDL